MRAYGSEPANAATTAAATKLDFAGMPRHDLQAEANADIPTLPADILSFDPISAATRAFS